VLPSHSGELHDPSEQCAATRLRALPLRIVRRPLVGNGAAPRNDRYGRSLLKNSAFKAQ
jgi:hypothetical protein